MTSPIDPSCRPLLDRLSAYLDGELPEVDCAEIEAHCRACPRCAVMIAGLQRTIALCREAPPDPIPPRLRARARARVARLLGTKIPKRDTRITKKA